MAEAKELAARRKKGLLAHEKIVAYSTATVSGLLALASVLTSVSTARITDLAGALFLAGLGW